MKKLVSLHPVLLLASPFFAQPDLGGLKLDKSKFPHLVADDPTVFLNEIKAADLRSLLTVLTSDSLEGRETGQPGQRKAADFIARQFEEIGLPKVCDGNSYFQKILLTSESWEKISLTVGKEEFRSNFNYYAYPASTPDVGEVKIDDLMFLGYGIDDPKYSDYRSEDVKNKAILIYMGEPRRPDSTFLTTGTRLGSPSWKGWKAKAELAKKKGVAAVFIIDPNIQASIKANRQELSGFRMTPKAGAPDEKLAPVVFISQEVAEAIPRGWSCPVQQATAVAPGSVQRNQVG